MFFLNLFFVFSLFVRTCYTVDKVGEYRMTKYEELYHEVLQRIESGEFPVGEVIPKEFDLMEEYHCSRDTIRKSLQMLSQNGYIQKTKRKGSVVLDRKRYEFPVSGVISFKELASTMKGKVETIVTCCELITPDNTMMAALNITGEDKVWKVERVRKIDGERIILDLDILNASLIPDLTKEIAEDSLYHYIEHTLHLKIGYANKEITCETVSAHDLQLLDMHGFDMVVNVDSYTCLHDTRVFQFTRSRHRPDKFRFNDFARR